VILVPSSRCAGRRREKPDQQWRLKRLVLLQRRRALGDGCGRRMRSQTTAAVPKRHVISGAEAAVLTASGRMQRARDGRAESFAQAEWRPSLDNQARTLPEVDVRLLVTARNHAMASASRVQGRRAREPKRQLHVRSHVLDAQTGAVGSSEKGKETQRRGSTASAKRKDHPCRLHHMPCKSAVVTGRVLTQRYCNVTNGA
jgi:hypothetical protein